MRLARSGRSPTQEGGCAAASSAQKLGRVVRRPGQDTDSLTSRPRAGDPIRGGVQRVADAAERDARNARLSAGVRSWPVASQRRRRLEQGDRKGSRGSATHSRTRCACASWPETRGIASAARCESTCAANARRREELQDVQISAARAPARSPCAAADGDLCSARLSPRRHGARDDAFPRPLAGGADAAQGRTVAGRRAGTGFPSFGKRFAPRAILLDPGQRGKSGTQEMPGRARKSGGRHTIGTRCRLVHNR